MRFSHHLKQISQWGEYMTHKKPPNDTHFIFFAYLLQLLYSQWKINSGYFKIFLFQLKFKFKLVLLGVPERRISQSLI